MVNKTSSIYFSNNESISKIYEKEVALEEGEYHLKTALFTLGRDIKREGLFYESLTGKRLISTYTVLNMELKL
ncbi:MAG: hypothetical protein LBQ14_05560 [Treponema sp.]|nr:hypothetical protein [Treponema sp.]